MIFFATNGNLPFSNGGGHLGLEPPHAAFASATWFQSSLLTLSPELSPQIFFDGAEREEEEEEEEEEEGSQSFGNTLCKLP